MDVEINFLAVAVAAVVMFVVGGAWYSALFAKPWQQAAGLTDEQVAAHQGRKFGGGFVLSLVMAASLAAFVGSEGLQFGLFAGFAAGATFAAASLGLIYLFEAKSWRLFAINGSYLVIGFTAMGAIIGALQG